MIQVGGLSKSMRQTIRFELAAISGLIYACHIFRPQKETQEANFKLSTSRSKRGPRRWPTFLTCRSGLMKVI